jgi:hypothetical protein
MFLVRGVQRGHFSFQRERSEIMKTDELLISAIGLPWQKPISRLAIAAQLVTRQLSVCSATENLTAFYGKKNLSYLDSMINHRSQRMLHFGKGRINPLNALSLPTLWPLSAFHRLRSLPSTH